jgi:hypothetical protein
MFYNINLTFPQNLKIKLFIIYYFGVNPNYVKKKEK